MDDLQDTLTLTEIIQLYSIPIFVLLKAISSGQLKAETYDDEIIIKNLALKRFISKWKNSSERAWLETTSGSKSLF